jgi:hypothetical protein
MRVTTPRGNFRVFWKYETKSTGHLPHPGRPYGRVCCAIVPDSEDMEPMASRWVHFEHHQGVGRNKHEPRDGHWRRPMFPDKLTAAKWALASVLQTMIPREEIGVRRFFWHEYMNTTRLGRRTLAKMPDGPEKDFFTAVEQEEASA